MRGLNTEFTKYLEEFLTIILEGYKIIPISSYLYAFEVTATVFARNIVTFELLKKVLNEFCSLTFSNYLIDVEDFDNNPQLSEDLFGLLNRIIKLNPFFIMDSELFSNLVIVCINNIGISHIETSKALLSFLKYTIDFHGNKQMKDLENEQLMIYYKKVKDVIGNYGQQLVGKAINYIIEVPPVTIFDNLKDLLTKLIANFPQECIVWFTNSLTIVPHDCLTSTDKEKFINTISTDRINDLDEILEKFYRRCLGRLHRRGN